MRRNLVMGLAALMVLTIWTWLMVIEILDAIDAGSGQEVIRTDLRTWVTTLLTGLLGSALALLTSAQGNQGRLGALPAAMGFRGNTLPQVMAYVYAAIYIVGIGLGLIVVLTNEAEASTLLIAVTSGGLGTIATGVAAWMGLNFTPPTPPPQPPPEG